MGTAVDLPAAEAETANQEKRGSRRLSCDGSAEVSVLGGALRFTGKITNLSLTGCYVSTASHFNLERGTPVEIVMGLNRLQFRVAAGVRVLHRGAGIGLEFSNLSQRSNRYLKELMAELEAKESKGKAAGS